jgi:hypothetical protein
VNRSPAFERFVFSGFPVCEFRKDHDTRLKLKVESGLILKADFNDVVVGRNVQFDTFNDLAFGLRERQNTPIALLFGTLRNSHNAPRCAFWLGLRSCANMDAARSIDTGIRLTIGSRDVRKMNVLT